MDQESRLLPGWTLVTIIPWPNLPPMKSCMYRMRLSYSMFHQLTHICEKKTTCCGRWPWFNYTIYDNHLPCQGAISKHAQKIGVLIPTRHLYGKANCRNCRTKTCRNKDATALDLDTNTQYIPKLHLFKRALLEKSSNMPPFLHEPYFCFEWQ